MTMSVDSTLLAEQGQPGLQERYASERASWAIEEPLRLSHQEQSLPGSTSPDASKLRLGAWLISFAIALRVPVQMRSHRP